jgi:hypothetical protein
MNEAEAHSLLCHAVEGDAAACNALADALELGDVQHPERLTLSVVTRCTALHGKLFVVGEWVLKVTPWSGPVWHWSRLIAGPCPYDTLRSMRANYLPKGDLAHVPLRMTHEVFTTPQKRR